MIFSFKPKMAFVDKVKPGETFKVMTNDCFLGQLVDETQEYSSIDESKINPATGPILVEGAEPGDLLKVEVLNIEAASKGVAMIAPGEGLLGPKVEKPHIRVMPVAGGHIRFGHLDVPLRPMIGVIGVAPDDAEGEWPTDTPWKHGGNMDTADAGIGAALYFPVRQEGALLALGDCHAAMGDGEVGVSGCEIAAGVTLKVSLIKGKATLWPLLETGDETMVIASGDTLEEAAFSAIDETVKCLQKGLGLSWEDAYILSSLAVDVKINQVVNPKKTVRAAIPKALIETHLITG